jgi:hypothetical protein
MTNLTGEALDIQVQQRLELLWRWTRVVRHDLGNLLYPSDSTARTILEEPNWEAAHRYVRQTRTLVEMVDSSREVLGDVGGSRRDEQAGSTEFKAWWGHFGPMASTIFPGGRPLRAVVRPETRPIAAPRSLVGGVMLSVLLAVELQVEGVTAEDVLVHVEPDTQGEHVRINVQAREGSWPSIQPAAISSELSAKRGGSVTAEDGDTGGRLCVTFPAASRSAVGGA